MLMVAAGVQHIRKGRYAYPVLMAGWMHLALMSARNIPLFALVSAPFVAWGLMEALQEIGAARVPAWYGAVRRFLGDIEEEFGAFDRIPRWHAASAALFVFLLAAMYNPASPERFRAEFPLKKYPRALLDKMPAAEFTANVFTVDEWGDYLIYRHPETVKVFVDGRFDFYGAKHTQQYLDVLNAKHDWEKNLAAYNVQTVLLPVDTPLASVLKESGRWTAVYDDRVSILFHSRQLLAQRRQAQVSVASTAAVSGSETVTSPHSGDAYLSNPNL